MGTHKHALICISAQNGRAHSSLHLITGLVIHCSRCIADDRSPWRHSSSQNPGFTSFRMLGPVNSSQAVNWSSPLSSTFVMLQLRPSLHTRVCVLVALILIPNLAPITTEDSLSNYIPLLTRRRPYLVWGLQHTSHLMTSFTCFSRVPPQYFLLKLPRPLLKGNNIIPT